MGYNSHDFEAFMVISPTIELRCSDLINKIVGDGIGNRFAEIMSAESRLTLPVRGLGKRSKSVTLALTHVLLVGTDLSFSQ